MADVSFAAALGVAWPELQVTEARTELYRDLETYGERSWVYVSVSGEAQALIARGVLDAAEAASLPTGKTVTHRSRKIRLSASGRIRVILEAWDPPDFSKHQRKQENHKAMIDLLAVALAPDPWHPPVQSRK